jgi:hypothetical protein
MPPINLNIGESTGTIYGDGTNYGDVLKLFK